jgi:hypothetical protein
MSSVAAVMIAPVMRKKKEVENTYTHTHRERREFPLQSPSPTHNALSEQRTIIGRGTTPTRWVNTSVSREKGGAKEEEEKRWDQTKRRAQESQDLLKTNKKTMKKGTNPTAK